MWQRRFELGRCASSHRGVAFISSPDVNVLLFEPETQRQLPYQQACKREDSFVAFFHEPSDYTEELLVDQPAIELFAELGWARGRRRAVRPIRTLVLALVASPQQERLMPQLF